MNKMTTINDVKNAILKYVQGNMDKNTLVNIKAGYFNFPDLNASQLGYKTDAKNGLIADEDKYFCYKIINQLFNRMMGRQNKPFQYTLIWDLPREWDMDDLYEWFFGRPGVRAYYFNTKPGKKNMDIWSRIKFDTDESMPGVKFLLVSTLRME